MARWRRPDVAPLRPLLCALLAIAIAFASVASPWATTAHSAPWVPQQQMAEVGPTDMSDCERMRQATKSDCPDCRKDKTCADNFCMAKCFKVFGHLPDIGLPSVLATQAARLFRPDRLPDWSDQPLPTPPRS
jgi:hypothetical protein